MADVRELILARMETVVKGLAGFKTVERNLSVLPDHAELFPAVSIEDGGETPLDDELEARVRLPPQPRIMLMQPSIEVYAFGPAETRGEVLSEYRQAIVPAIVNDAGLAGLVPQDLRAYAGMETARAPHGQGVVHGASLQFAFVYMLQYQHLTDGVLSPDGSDVVSPDGSEVV